MFRILLCLTISVQNLLAQDDPFPITPFDNYVITNFTADNGLPQNTVDLVKQTTDGYIWIGTYAGLARYDGVKFVHYNRSITPAFKMNHVTTMLEDKNGAVWIGTNGVTRKVADLRKDPRVTLMYFNAAGQEYVTVIGKAVVDDDMAHKQAHWKPSWGMMVKDGYHGADFTLIRVQPSRLEVSSVKRGIFNDPVNWRPAIVELR